MDYSSFNEPTDRTTSQLQNSSLPNTTFPLSQFESTMRISDNQQNQQWSCQNGLDDIALQNAVFAPLESDQLAIVSQAQQTNNLIPTEISRLTSEPQDNKINRTDDKQTDQQTSRTDNRLRMERGFNGLAYAEECKEKAREEYKEMKRKEHMQNGQHDRLKRRRKNDSSMTTDQKYRRRLQMNQDSAAAARYAQDVYVRTLEKLVQESEVHINNLQQVVQGVQHMERERENIANHLIARNQELELVLQQQQQTRENVRHPQEQHQQQQELDALAGWKKNIPHPAWVSTLGAPETMSAQANDSDLASGGVRPAPAV